MKLMLTPNNFSGINGKVINQGCKDETMGGTELWLLDAPPPPNLKHPTHYRKKSKGNVKKIQCF